MSNDLERAWGQTTAGFGPPKSTILGEIGYAFSALGGEIPAYQNATSRMWRLERVILMLKAPAYLREAQRRLGEDYPKVIKALHEFGQKIKEWDDALDIAQEAERQIQELYKATRPLITLVDKAERASQARIQVRPGNYRGNAGFVVSGTDADGHPGQSIFVHTQGGAEKVRNLLKTPGRDPKELGRILTEDAQAAGKKA